jgi:insertion element IS1 protein InsB
MKPYLLCPMCDSDEMVKNGRNHRGKQSYKCKDCGRQFVENPGNSPLDNQHKEYIDRLLLERISLAGIARVLQISESSLQNYVNDTYEKVPQQVNVIPKEKKPLTVRMDELWSFVDSKGNKQWVWLAMDAQTREIIGCYTGLFHSE